MKKLYSLFVIIAAMAVFGAYQTVNIGTNPNDGTGDTLRNAFTKVNANFAQVTADFAASTNVPGFGLWITNRQSNVFLTNSQIAYPQFGTVYSFDGRNLLVNGVVALQTTAPDGVYVAGPLTVGSYAYFPTGLPAPAWGEGSVFYDDTEKTLAYYNDRTGMTVNIGQESVVRVDNKTGTDIPDGKVVYISGAHGHNPEISLAVATNELMSCIIGVTTTWVTNNGSGYVTTEGLIHDLDTLNIGIDGQAVYISTNLPGELSVIDCKAPFHSVQVGIIAYSHPTQGILFVSPRYKHITASNITDLATFTMISSNFVSTTWKWVDVLQSGSTLASNPSGDPPILTEVPGGSNYFGYAYYYDDKSYFSIQGVHKFASTNAANPNVWFEPHVHISCTNLPANLSNATFRMDLVYAPVFGLYTNGYVRTNTFSFTNSYRHGLLSFGNITNNALSGRSSVVFKGRITRLNGGDGDLGASNPVWVDSLDIHMPTTELGSIGQGGD